MKKTILFVIVIFGMTSVYSQEKGKIRVGIDAGYSFAKDIEGVFLYLEPKYNITENSAIGLRLGLTIFDYYANESYLSLSGGANVLATYDYYFNKNGSSIAPFLGAGLGYHRLGHELFDNEDYIFGINEFGAMIRGGIELGKLRLSFEYNLIPKTDFGDSKSIKNSYFGTSLGFYFGGGKWKK